MNLLGFANSRAKKQNILSVKELRLQGQFSTTLPNCFQNSINATFYKALKLCSVTSACHNHLPPVNF